MRWGVHVRCAKSASKVVQKLMWVTRGDVLYRSVLKRAAAWTKPAIRVPSMFLEHPAWHPLAMA